MTDKAKSKGRMTVRLISRDVTGAIASILEQEIPATQHEIALFLRRDPCRLETAEALLAGQTVTIERKERT